MKLFPHLILSGLLSFVLATPSGADTGLPMRDGPRPATTKGIPHKQIGAQSVPSLSEELLRRADALDGVNLGRTRISVQGAVGFHLDTDYPVAQPKSIVAGREFAHLHPDGSLHAALHPDLAQEAIAKGWATFHPWSLQRDGWEGFVMLYAPTNLAELDVVSQLVAWSHLYITQGRVSN